MVLQKSYVAEGGELWAQKRCKSKPPLTALQSRSHLASNLKVARGNSLRIKPHPDPDEGSVNEKVVVVETSTQSINRRRGGSGSGDRTISPWYHDG
jgi:hypothetical protein